MTISEIVYAIHDFEAENEDELNFCTGEPIVIIQKDDGFDDGWWKGKNTKGEEGLFPMNYISYQSCHHQLPTPSNSSNRKPVDSISSEERPPVSSAQLKKSVIQSLLHPELKSTSPEYWDINQVETWLNVIDFGSIAESFKTQEITGDILLELTMGSLKELDVPTFGKRFKLQTAINVLREEYCLPQNLPISNTYYSINKKPTNQYKRQSIYLQEEKEINFMTSDNKKRADLPQHLDELKNISFPSNQPAVLPIDHGYSRTEDDTAPQIEGWLHKQGCKYRTWNKRWFVLKGPNLFYFKSPKDVRMKGIINLRGYRIIHDKTIQPGKYSFKAQHEEERTFYFYTDEESQMRSWMTNLMKSTITRDLSTPVLSSRVIPSVSLEMARLMDPRPPSVLLYKKPTCETSLVTEASIDSGFDSDQHSPTSSIRQYEEDEGIEQDAGSWGYAEFIEWVNAICPEDPISSLDQLKQDNLLVTLLQELSGKKVSNTHSSQDTVALAFDFMAKEGIPAVNELFSVQDVYQGNQDKIIFMLRSILEWSL